MSLTRVFSAAAVGLLLIGLAGCSTDSSGGSVGAPADGGIGEVQIAPGEPMPMPEGMIGEIAPDSMIGRVAPDLGGGPIPGVADQGAARSIVRSASIEVTVKSAPDAAAKAVSFAEELGGSVSSQSVSNDGGSINAAQLTLRVPSDRLGEALDKLGTLGEVRSEHRSADDVTETHVDLQARTEALQASIDRLTALMEGAASTSELIEAETALTDRQQQLDGLRAQLEALEGQVDQADIWVSLNEKSALPGGGPKSFWDAIVTGFTSIGSFFAAVYIAVGVALPWLALIALVVLAIVIPVRLRRRRARNGQSPEKPLSAEPTDSVASDDRP